MALAAGTRLGRYKVHAKIGSGGMGEVYLAQDLDLGRDVALKILPAELTNDESSLRRFQREARAASSLNHPNILTVHEIGFENGTHFIATEYIEGQTLRDHVTTGPMAISEVLDIAVQVASALAAAHAAGVFHRDIKPDNIMVRSDRIVKVLDFGLAKLTQRETSDSHTPTLVKTEAGLVMGTARYMSPEQVRGVAVDSRTDVWSLGVVIYELVTGRTVFAGATASDVMAAVLEREPPPLNSVSEEVPSELVRIVSKALRKDREERYQTIGDMLVDLKTLKQEFDSDRRMKRPPSQPWDVVTEIGPSSPAKPTEKEAVQTQSSLEYLAGGLKRHRGLVIVLMLVTAAVLIAAYFYLKENETAIDSIAVMPFINASADPNAEYLSDGITESLINSLSQFPKLRVVPRSTVFRYKGREIDPRVVGRELGVRAVLTGKVVQRGDSLIIQTDLVDVAEESQVWGQQYNSKFADIFGVQEEISRQISEKLRMRLSGEERKQLSKRHTANPQAYELYLKGRYHWNRRTAEDLKKGNEYFQRAIDIDPTYALAYSGVADSYLILGNFGLMPPKEAYPRAKAAADTALSMDSNLVEAQVSSAFIKFLFDGDWPAAEAGFKRAIEANPNYGPAHQWYGVCLVGVGRSEEAIAEVKRAQQVDPLSLTINGVVGWVLYLARDYDQAIDQEKKTLEMDQNFTLARRYLGMAYEEKGLYKEAIEEFRKAIQTPEPRPLDLSALGHVYARAGKHAEARKLLDEVKSQTAQNYFPSYDVAIIYVALGQKDEAFTWLEKAYEERYPWLIHLKVDPRLDPLRSDPRFAELVRRLRLPAALPLPVR